MTFPFFGIDGRPIDVRPAAHRHAPTRCSRARGLTPHLRALAQSSPRARRRRRSTSSACSTTSPATTSPTPRCRRRPPRRSTASCSTPSRATASSTRARWRCCCGWPASPRASSPASRTGATDFKTGEYVVRDFDAHSWVEAYYPSWGWLTFDPTPADSPGAQPAARTPRSIPSNGGAGGSTSFGGDPVSERGAGVAGRRRAGAVVADPGDRRRRAGRCRPRLPRAAPLARAARRRRCRSSSARCGARAANRRPEPRCTRSSCASRPRPPPPATCARCARAATATRRAIRPARSAAACGPSSDAAAVCWAAFAPGGPSRRGNSRAYN